MFKRMVSRFRYQRQFIVLYFLFMFFAFSVVTIVFYYYSTKAIENDNIGLMNEINVQISNSIDIVMNDLDRLTQLHIMDSNIEKVLSKKDLQNSADMLKDQKYMNNIIYHIRMNNDYIWDVFYLGRNGVLYSNEYVSNGYTSLLRKWSFKTERGRLNFMTDAYIGNTGNNVTRKVVTVSRKMYTRSLQEMGYIFFNLDHKKLSSIFTKNTADHQTSHLLVLGNTELIFDSYEEHRTREQQRQFLDKLALNRDWSGQSAFKVKIGNQRYLVTGLEHAKTGWKLIRYVENDTLFHLLLLRLKIFLFVILLLFFIASLGGYYLYRKTSKSVTILRKAMKKVENSQFITLEEDGYPTEISELIRSFNRMSTQLEESFNKIVLSEVNQKKLELKILQSQINPHFLYNTLNLMSSIASLHDIKDISKVADNLSDMFRYNIKGKQAVRIREEIEQIRKYLEIQQMRFPDKFSVAYLCDDRLLDCQIPKFTLQPIVENAVYHGIEQTRRRGDLLISVEEEDGDIRITVRDNGKGMNDSALEQLNRKLDEDVSRYLINEHQSNMGLLNVHYRIKEYYGSQYGLSIWSKENKGTTVTLKIPQQGSFN